MVKHQKIKYLIIISNLFLFIVFLAIGAFGVGDLDWDKAKSKVHKFVSSTMS